MVDAISKSLRFCISCCISLLKPLWCKKLIVTTFDRQTIMSLAWLSVVESISLLEFLISFWKKCVFHCSSQKVKQDVATLAKLLLMAKNRGFMAQHNHKKRLHLDTCPYDSGYRINVSLLITHVDHMEISPYNRPKQYFCCGVLGLFLTSIRYKKQILSVFKVFNASIEVRYTHKILKL